MKIRSLSWIISCVFQKQKSKMGSLKCNPPNIQHTQNNIKKKCCFLISSAGMWLLVCVQLCRPDMVYWTQNWPITCIAILSLQKWSISCLWCKWVIIIQLATLLKVCKHENTHINSLTDTYSFWCCISMNSSLLLCGSLGQPFTNIESELCSIVTTYLLYWLGLKYLSL